MDYQIPFITIEEKITAFEMGDDAPGFIIEGNTDKLFYSRLLKKCNIKIDEFDIVIGNGKKTIIKYYEEDKFNFPYLAIIDSDYDRYNNCCIEDSNILYTHFYNIENYLTQEEIIGQTIEDYSNFNTQEIIAEEMIKEAINSILPYIIGCLIKLNNGYSIKIEDCGIMRWWNEENKCINKTEIRDYLLSEIESLNITELELCYRDNKELIVQKEIEQIDLILNGKRKLEAVYKQFEIYFPEETSCNRHSGFRSDLRKNMFKSEYILELVDSINDKFSLLL